MKILLAKKNRFGTLSKFRNYWAYKTLKKLLTYILFVLFAYCSIFHIQSKRGFFELPIVSAFDADIELEEKIDFSSDISFFLFWSVRCHHGRESGHEK